MDNRSPPIGLRFERVNGIAFTRIWRRLDPDDTKFAARSGKLLARGEKEFDGSHPPRPRFETFAGYLLEM